MLLDLLIALIVLVVLVVVLKYAWAFFEFPPALLKVVMIVIGGIFLIYLLINLWPLLTSPGGWRHHQWL